MTGASNPRWIENRSRFMHTLYWTFRLVRDIVLQGWVNSSMVVSAVVLLLLLTGLLIAGVQVSAPFIYTLF
jgi:hypothetical protein